MSLLKPNKQKFISNQFIHFIQLYENLVIIVFEFCRLDSRDTFDEVWVPRWDQGVEKVIFSICDDQHAMLDSYNLARYACVCYDMPIATKLLLPK